MFTVKSLFTFALKSVYTCMYFIVTDSDIGEGTNSKHVYAHTATMFPSSQLSELDLAYKRGGWDEARQLLQSQSTEEVYR